MNLGDFLSNASSSPPLPAEPVSFTALHVNVTGDTLKVPVNAVLVCISEKERQECLRRALVHCRKEYPSADGIPPERLAEEERFQMLAEALRDADDPRKAFAHVLQLRSVISPHEVTKLWQTLEAFMQREFPPIIDAAEFEKLVQDAKKKSLPDLLSSTGYLILSKALPVLALYFQNAPTHTSSDTEHA
jgi:hypothetical protein